MLALILSLAFADAVLPAKTVAAPPIFEQQAEDWPTFRHDAARSGRTSEKLAWELVKPSWQQNFAAPTPAWPGPAQWDAFAALPGLKSMRDYDSAYHVIAVGDAIYFSSNSGVDATVQQATGQIDHVGVYCLNAADGSLRWSYATSAPVRVAPTYQGDAGGRSGGKLYFGDDSGTAYCLNAADGQVVWSFAPHADDRQVIHDGRFISFAPIRTGVLVHDGQAYFGASFLPWKSSYLYSVNAKTGKANGAKSFARDLGAGWTLEGPMLASSTHLVMPQGRVSPLIFSREDGTPQGTLEGGGGSFCLLTDDDQVLHGPGHKTGWITASDASGRAKIASYDKGNSIVVEGQTAYLLSDRALTAFDRESQALIWSRPVDTPYTLIQSGPNLVAGGDGVVRVFDCETGAELWATQVDGQALGLVVAQKQLLVSCHNGNLYGFAAAARNVVHPSLASWQPASHLEWTSSQDLTTPPPIAKNQERGLLDHWLFQSNALSQVQLAADDPRTTAVYSNLASRPLAAMPLGAAPMQQFGDWHYLTLDGRQGDLEVAKLDQDKLLPSRVVSKTARPMKLPQKEMTVEAWARVDHVTEWGGLVGATQDNGEYERGWILGYRKDRFSFALKAEKGSDRLSWLRAPTAYATGSWHHVAATYDGKIMRLYVDGVQVGEGNEQSGAIHYPEEGWYQLGAYRDKDEYFRSKGAMHEVRVYDRALKADAIQKHYLAKVESAPPPVKIAVPRSLPVATLELQTQPWIRLHADDGSADVYWTSAAEVTTKIEFIAAADVPGPDGKFPSPPVSGWPQVSELSYSVLDVNELATIASSKRAGKIHAVRIHGLQKNQVGHFRVLHEVGGEVKRSKIYELDMHFAWARPAEQLASSNASSSAPVPANDSVLSEVAAAVGSAAPMVLVVEEFDSVVLQVIRNQIQRQFPASKVHFTTVAQLQTLPPLCADLVLSRSDSDAVSHSQNVANLQRLVAPGGLLASSNSLSISKKQFTAAGQIGNLNLYRRLPLAGAGAWSHLYGRPDNTAFGGETLAGSSTVEELETQWVAPPGPRYQTDRQNRRPAPLATAGRLFLQGKDRLMALNSFNGQLLWSWELPELNRFNMPRDCSNWCADDDAVYVAIGDSCWQLDAASGVQNQRLQVSEDMEWGYVARADDLLLGSEVKPGQTFTDWWGGTYWYDAREGSATEKVCSDSLFAHDLTQNQLRWKYQNGLILNTTITIADQRVYFLENRSPELQEQATRRFAGTGLFDDLHMVALDLQTGDVVWQRPAKPLPGDVATWLAASDGHLLLVTSHRNPDVGQVGGEFAVYAFDADSGDSQWRRKFTWEVDHHGKSISRPAIVGGQIYLRPLVLDLADGKVLRQQFPEGHQCGSYAASSNAVFLRCGNLAVWSREDWTASRWERLRPDCWISTIPANGMLLSPEGGGGCSCGSWIETSLGFLPRSVDGNEN
ncbi:MAG: PQQ-binding-like beta-propeller repeat protein [Planctomycetes bacterium]|nr:PQQ-binding-like beta-propeller repeat protein [Planctomycetota bacterium]